MNGRFAYLIAGALALIAASQGAISAAPARQAPTNVEIVVGGVPLQRYAHGGRWYVEAVKGREYAIQLRNPYPVRVAVALSVDGLNTIDARETTAADARKWVLDPYETVVISGWQTNRDEARRSPAPTEQQAPAAAGADARAKDDYAATGMGRATAHAVTQVWLDLEEAP